MKTTPLTSEVDIETNKTCCACKESKPLSSFHKKNPTQYCPRCKKCRSEYTRQLRNKKAPNMVADLVGEEWKPLVFFKAKPYAVSNLGRIKALPTKWYRGESIRPPIKLERGRVPFITLYNPKTGKTLSKTIHRLVAIAFVPNPENKPEVRFNDGDVWNLKASNLAWGTRAEHIKHGYDVLGKTYQRAERHSSAKITNEDALFIFSYKGNPRDLVNMYPQLKRDTIHSIRTGETWGSITNSKIA